MEICNSLSPPYLQKAWTRLKWTMSSFCRFFPWVLFVCSQIHQFCIHSSSMSYMPGFWNYFRIFFFLLQDRNLLAAGVYISTRVSFFFFITARKKKNRHLRQDVWALFILPGFIFSSSACFFCLKDDFMGLQ